MRPGRRGAARLAAPAGTPPGCDHRLTEPDAPSPCFDSGTPDVVEYDRTAGAHN